MHPLAGAARQGPWEELTHEGNADQIFAVLWVRHPFQEVSRD